MMENDFINTRESGSELIWKWFCDSARQVKFSQASLVHKYIRLSNFFKEPTFMCIPKGQINQNRFHSEDFGLDEFCFQIPIWH